MVRLGLGAASAVAILSVSGFVDTQLIVGVGPHYALQRSAEKAYDAFSVASSACGLVRRMDYEPNAFFHSCRNTAVVTDCESLGNG